MILVLENRRAHVFQTAKKRFHVRKQCISKLHDNDVIIFVAHRDKDTEIFILPAKYFRIRFEISKCKSFLTKIETIKKLAKIIDINNINDADIMLGLYLEGVVSLIVAHKTCKMSLDEFIKYARQKGINIPI